MEYIDLQLRLGRRLARNRYAVTARSEVGGEAHGEFVSPLSRDQLENFILKIGITRRGRRQIHSPEWRAAQDLGQRLFKALFTEEIRANYLATHNDAVRHGKGMRLQLVLENPELTEYPWEFLYDAASGQFLSLYEETPIVRFIELPRPILPLATAPPLRVVALAPSPKDYEQLDVARERKNLDAALESLVRSKLLEVDWVAAPTLDGLRAQLLQREYHIFHFIGHGSFDRAHDDGILAFENEDGRAVQVSGERLGIFLGNHRTLRLAVLNACEGARTSPEDPFAGTASTLVRSGNLPAVVAMQFEITDTAAIDFGRGFYGALANGRTVDAAVSQGRQAIFARDNDVEWGTPVLYLRAADGQIFDLAAGMSEAQRRAAAAQAEQERLVRERAEQARLEHERAAAARAEQERLARVQFLDDLMEHGQKAFDAQDWQTAIATFERLIAEDASYREAVTPLLEQARAGALEPLPATEPSHQAAAPRAANQEPEAAQEQTAPPAVVREPAIAAPAVRGTILTPEQSPAVIGRLGLVVLCSALGLAFSGAQAVAQYYTVAGEYEPGIGTYALIPALVIAGALAGWMLSLALRLVVPQLQSGLVLTLVVGWGLAFFSMLFLGANSPDTFPIRPVIVGIAAALVTALVLWQGGITTNPFWLGAVVLAFVIGLSIQLLSPDLQQNTYATVENSVLATLDFIGEKQLIMLKVAVLEFFFGALGVLAGCIVLYAMLRWRRGAP